MVSSWAWMGYVYATEVPDGFTRISYDVLQPTPQPDEESQELIPASAEALEGQKVFIKGYMHPLTILPASDRVRSFVLVRDNGDCCFGAAQPKLTDMILVELTGNLRMQYRTRQVKLAGTFHVDFRQGTGGVGTLAYRLDAEHAQ
jgi:hypothetical protein